MPTTSPDAASKRDVAGRRATSRTGRIVPVVLALFSLAIFVGKWVFADLDPLRSRLLTGDVLTLAWAPGPLPYYSGWITLTGVLGWIIAGAAAVLAGWVLRTIGRGTQGGALLFGGVLSIALGVDDLYLIHEAALSTHGVPEGVTIAVLVAGALLWGGVYRREILRGRESLLIVLAAAWFALSLATEAIGAGVAFFEEPTKTAGIVCWAAWLWLRSLAALRSALRAAAPVPDAAAAGQAEVLPVGPSAVGPSAVGPSAVGGPTGPGRSPA